MNRSGITSQRLPEIVHHGHQKTFLLRMGNLKGFTRSHLDIEFFHAADVFHIDDVAMIGPIELLGRKKLLQLVQGNTYMIFLTLRMDDGIMGLHLNEDDIVEVDGDNSSTRLDPELLFFLPLHLGKVSGGPASRSDVPG